MTRAVFQSKERVLWWIKALNSRVRQGTSSWDNSFNNLDGKLSGPVTLKGSIVFNNGKTPWIFISMFDMVGHKSSGISGKVTQSSFVKTEQKLHLL